MAKLVVYLKLVIILAVVQTSCSQKTFSVDELLVVIVNQPNHYHAQFTDNLRHFILQEGLEKYGKAPNVVLSKELVATGDWTITPLVSPMLAAYPQCHWFFICDDHTVVNLVLLMELLLQHNYDKDLLLGYPVTDTEPTIIHHFSPDHRVYPNLASGVALTKGLLKSLQKALTAGQKPYGDFTLDASYELAILLELLDPPLKLTPVADAICVTPKIQCASYPTSQGRCRPVIDERDILFAVKTCKKYQESRVEVVMRTWGKYLSNIIFFTDKIDGSFTKARMETLDNVKPVQYGHCEKLQGILQRTHAIMQNNSPLQWLVVTDDDTILGISRMIELLSCFGEGSHEVVVLGERYGYGYNNIYNKRNRGYDYITGGAGIVLSAAALQAIAKKGGCPPCPSAKAPDDMWLGACLQSANVTVIHLPLFHQARPMDYPREYLLPHRPVSFHKHWLVDPIAIYKTWFEEADFRYLDLDYHDEL